MDISPALPLVLNVTAVLVIGYGLLRRRSPRVHVPVMLTALVIDAVTVTLVELRARSVSGHGAVEQGLGALAGGSDFLATFHVAVSSLCVVGYLVAIVTGYRLLRGGRGRRIHRANALVFGLLRMASLVTSFWM